MPSDKELKQAAYILTLQEENKNLRLKTEADNRSRIEQDRYIHDVLSSHYGRIQLLRVAIDGNKSELSHSIRRILDAKEPSVESAALKRRAVLAKKEKD